MFCWRNLDFNFKGTKSETSLQERRLGGAPVMGVRKMFIVTGIGIREHLLTVARVQVPPPQTPGSRRAPEWYRPEASSLCLTCGQISLRDGYLFYQDMSPWKSKLKAWVRNAICIGWYESSRGKILRRNQKSKAESWINIY